MFRDAVLLGPKLRLAPVMTLRVVEGVSVLFGSECRNIESSKGSTEAASSSAAASAVLAAAAAAAATLLVP